MDMVKCPANNRKISNMLLRESLWKIEDRLTVLVESVADHEAELIHLRRQMLQVSAKIEESEALSHKKKNRRQSSA